MANKILVWLSIVILFWMTFMQLKFSWKLIAALQTTDELVATADRRSQTALELAREVRAEARDLELQLAAKVEEVKKETAKNIAEMATMFHVEQIDPD